MFAGFRLAVHVSRFRALYEFCIVLSSYICFWIWFFAQASIVFCGITIFGVLSFWLTPEEKWLSREQIQRMYDGADDVSGR